MLTDITNTPSAQQTVKLYSPVHTPHTEHCRSSSTYSIEDPSDIIRRYSVVNIPHTTSYDEYMTETNVDDMVNASICTEQLHSDNVQLVQQLELLQQQYNELQHQYAQLQQQYNDSLQQQHTRRPSTAVMPSFAVTRQYKQLTVHSRSPSVSYSPVQQSSPTTPARRLHRRSASTHTVSKINDTLSHVQEPQSAKLSSHTPYKHNNLCLYKPIETPTPRTSISIPIHTAHYRRPSAVQRNQALYAKLAGENDADVIELLRQIKTKRLSCENSVNHTTHHTITVNTNTDDMDTNTSIHIIEPEPFNFGSFISKHTINAVPQITVEEWECL